MENIPEHLGIIVDGNRRFAKRLNQDPKKGHEYGAKKLGDVLKWCKELGIKKLTLFIFSLENFHRPKEEFDYLMNIFRKEFDKLKDDKRLQDLNIKVRVIGRIELFPKDIQEKIKEVMEKTKDNDKYELNFAFGYSGRAEIVDATKKIIQGKLRPEDIDEKSFAEYLYLNDDVDLIIRTSGEKRTSGFLLWQGSYAEYVFVNKLWPEFEKEDFVKAIKDYSGRERRFGG